MSVIDLLWEKETKGNRRMTEKEKSEIRSNVLKINVQIIANSGLWKNTTSSPTRLRRGTHTTCFVLVRLTITWTLYCIFFGRPFYIYTNRQNLLAVCDGLSNLFNDLLFFIKLTSLLHEDRVQALVSGLRDTFRFDTSGDRFSRELLLKSGRFCFNFTVGALFLVGLLLALNLFPSKELYLSRKPIYDNIWLPFNVSAPYLYEGYLAFFSVITYTNFSCNTMADMLIVTSLIHACVQLQILARKLTALKETAGKNVLKRIRKTSLLSKPREETGRQRVEDAIKKAWIDEEMKILLKECVEHHVSLLRFGESFIEFAHVMFVPQIVCNLIASVLLVYYATSVEELDRNSTAMLQMFCSYVTELFILSWVADAVSEMSAKLKDAVFACDWLDASPSFKRSMGIMISTTNQPMVLKLAGFVPLSLVTFSNVMQTSYSYLMVMKSV